jgi:hypothetical protein
LKTRDYLDKLNRHPIFLATYCQERKVSAINKFQITNCKQITMTKIPNFKHLVFDLIWDLGIGIYLYFGACNLLFPDYPG